MDPIALALAGVRFRYPAAAADALAGVSLAVAPGEGIALLGPNGAGKTTLARLAMALLQPGEGRIESAGRDTAGLGPEDLADRVGFLFQQPEVQLFARTVQQEVMFGPRQLGWAEPRIAEAAAAVLDELALTQFTERHPYDLPAPWRRLLALATALIVEPRLLLLDEPTAGLDRESRRLVEAVVRRRRERGTAVVAITHDAAFALEALDRGVVLERGQVTVDGPLAPVLAAPGAPLGLPPHAEIARRLALAPASLRLADVAWALAQRCSASNGPVS